MTTHIQRPATVTAHIDTDSISASPTEPVTVWVLRRWDWHDDDITVYSTQDRALADLAKYVKRSWSKLAQQEDVPALPPTDPREAIRYSTARTVIAAQRRVTSCTRRRSIAPMALPPPTPVRTSPLGRRRPPTSRTRPTIPTWPRPTLSKP
ncbi:hypothetical protein [Streptomyces goshikiensis]|uniref:hypothetical protein n=1 Tax=Streptomyces goshikiensis TaxID=1942 RepID=UPI00365D79D0